METTFITIHDLSPQGRLLYSSDSIVDILGYTPDEVLGRSCWDFFHPDELPFARELHSRGVSLDKAAVLSYCQLRNRQSQWICCECCFTIVYDVMVVCTSIYRRGLVSQARALQAPIVRRLFSSSPKDPRYHMLSHLSKRFNQSEQERTHEPRAALFLNRFTRTLTIMYATAGVEKILGISGEDMKGKSFYYCIQENCLDDAVRCLESAKANDSIAYLRFWFRDPRTDDPPSQDDTETVTGTDTDASMTDVTSDLSESEWDDGLDAPTPAKDDSGGRPGLDQEQTPAVLHNPGPVPESDGTGTPVSVQPRHPLAAEESNSDVSRTSSGADSLPADQSRNAIFGGRSHDTSHSSDDATPLTSPDSPDSNTRHHNFPDVELEAVISCTSDGLVVCLRRARPLVPESLHQPPVHQPTQKSGVFAAPWATEPVYHPSRPDQYASLMHGYDADHAVPNTCSAASNGFIAPPQGPSAEALFNSIRDTAIFAWALTSINGTLADHATNPQAATGESQPPDGLPIWQPTEKAYSNGSLQNSGAGDASAREAVYNSISPFNGTGPGHIDSQMNGHETGFGAALHLDPHALTTSENTPQAQ